MLLLAQGFWKGTHTLGVPGEGWPDIRADRWFPPALDQAQQEEFD